MPVCVRALARLLVAVAVVLAPTVPARALGADPCRSGGRTVAELNAAFDGGIPGLLGADYQRTVPLPGGRVLWLLQDAIVSRPGGRRTRLVHNVGVLQVGRCFSLLTRGTDVRPRPWLAPELTESFDRWFWPLAGAMAGDGTLRIFLAEMREQGTNYLSRTEPVATWMATVDPTSLTMTSVRPAPSSSPSLYGWTVASDRRFTYLFAHCYRSSDSASWAAIRAPQRSVLPGSAAARSTTCLVTGTGGAGSTTRAPP